MSSVFEEVLLTTDTDATTLKDEIAQLEKEIVKLKQETKKFILDNYNEVVPLLHEDKRVLSRAKTIINEIHELQERVDIQTKVKLKGTSKELQTLSNSLKEVKYSLAISNQLLTVHNYLIAAKTFIQNDEYIKAAKDLEILDKIIYESDLKNLDIIPPMRSEYFNLNVKLSSNVSSLWEQIIHEETTTNLDNIRIIKLILTCNDTLKTLIEAMQHIKELDKCLQKFCNNLLLSFVKPIAGQECLVHVEHAEDATATFTVEVIGTSFNHNVAFQNLKLLFQFLIDCFDLKSKENEHLMIKFCQYLYPLLSEILIDHCVDKTIPTSKSELEKYDLIKKDIIEFEDELITYGFISSESRYLTEYVSNVNHLYTKKIRQGFLVRAKELVKKDLHDSIMCEPKEPVEIPTEFLDHLKLNILDRALSKYTFQLPECQISKSVDEILDLLHEILDECCKNDGECALELYYTSRGVVEIYIGLTVFHHRKFLETIPQQVALFHNNCMFLAHHLITLPFKYENKLPETVQNYFITYIDQAFKLRSLGTKYFLKQLAYQNNIIKNILDNSGLSSIGLSSKLSGDTEKALRQCLRQLGLLQTVWFDVLPDEIFFRTIGLLMNSMIEELITKVTSVEDIPADVATELVSLYNIVIRRAPSIFPEPVDMGKYVEKWTKLKELIIILNASLKEIEERWSNGNGPLAHEFSAEIVRRLIKALFQNTDRRSALLSKIKE